MCSAHMSGLSDARVFCNILLHGSGDRDFYLSLYPWFRWVSSNTDNVHLSVVHPSYSRFKWRSSHSSHPWRWGCLCPGRHALIRTRLLPTEPLVAPSGLMFLFPGGCTPVRTTRCVLVA